MTETIDLRLNLQLKPTFRKDQLVSLKKTVTDHGDVYFEEDDYNNFFQKGCVFFVVQCGMCHYLIGDANEPLTLVDNEEFCIVTTPDESLEDEGMQDVSGKVRATDLQIYNFGDEDED